MTHVRAASIRRHIPCCRAWVGTAGIRVQEKHLYPHWARTKILWELYRKWWACRLCITQKSGSNFRQTLTFECCVMCFPCSYQPTCLPSLHTTVSCIWPVVHGHLIVLTPVWGWRNLFFRLLSTQRSIIVKANSLIMAGTPCLTVTDRSLPLSDQFSGDNYLPFLREVPGQPGLPGPSSFICVPLSPPQGCPLP